MHISVQLENLIMILFQNNLPLYKGNNNINISELVQRNLESVVFVDFKHHHISILNVKFFILYSEDPWSSGKVHRVLMNNNIWLSDLMQRLRFSSL